MAPDGWLRTSVTAWTTSVRQLWWVFIVVAVVLTLVTSNPADSTRAEIFDSLVTNLVVSLSIGVFVTVLYAVGVDRFVDRLQRPAARGLVHALTLAVSIAAGSELALVVLTGIYGQFDVPRARVIMWQVASGVGAGTMIATVLYSRIRDRAQELEVVAERGRRETAEAQLEAAQARTHPHFLFNSLNTIAALIEEDPALAVEAVERLSDLLRYALEGRRTKLVLVQEELDAVKSYASIQRMRFSDRLVVEFDVQGDARAAVVPPFSIQPLVENAIKHGVAQSHEGGRVRVIAAVEPRQLRIEVHNTGPQRSNAGGTGVGHEDLRRRLQLIYGDEHEFHAGPRDDGYVVSLVLPPTPDRP